MIDDTHVHLKAAIITQAINDYARALKSEDEQQAQYLERWFKSEWGEFLSGNSGNFIVEKTKKELQKGR